MGYNIHPYINPQTGGRIGLRERTIQRLRTEGLFDMRFWNPVRTRDPRYGCQTASCLAGNIVLAADDLGLPVRTGIDAVPYQARDIWASQYGEDEACMLDFYGVRIAPYRQMEEITPDEVIEHLESVRQ